MKLLIALISLVTLAFSAHAMDTTPFLIENTQKAEEIHLCELNLKYTSCAQIVFEYAEAKHPTALKKNTPYYYMMSLFLMSFSDEDGSCAKAKQFASTFQSQYSSHCRNSFPTYGDNGTAAWHAQANDETKPRVRFYDYTRLTPENWATFHNGNDPEIILQ